MDSLVKVISLNTPSEKKRNLYILSCILDEDVLYSGGQLSNYFNLVFLYYDLYNGYKIDNASQLVMAEFTKIIERDTDAIVLGHSFNGYMAYQLACALPQISYCVLIDTYNFFELSKYKGPFIFSDLMENIFRQIVVNKDFAYPLYLFRTFYKNKTYVKTENDDDFANGVDCFLEDLKNKPAINNCIFFKASRSFFRYKYHGYSWEPYVNGRFYLKNIITDHKGILATLNTVIAEYIYEKVSEKKVSAGQES